MVRVLLLKSVSYPIIILVVSFGFLKIVFSYQLPLIDKWKLSTLATHVQFQKSQKSDDGSFRRHFFTRLADLLERPVQNFQTGFQARTMGYKVHTGVLWFMVTAHHFAHLAICSFIGVFFLGGLNILAQFLMGCLWTFHYHRRTKRSFKKRTLQVSTKLTWRVTSCFECHIFLAPSSYNPECFFVAKRLSPTLTFFKLSSSPSHALRSLPGSSSSTSEEAVVAATATSPFSIILSHFTTISQSGEILGVHCWCVLTLDWCSRQLFVGKPVSSDFVTSVLLSPPSAANL